MGGGRAAAVSITLFRPAAERVATIFGDRARPRLAAGLALADRLEGVFFLPSRRLTCASWRGAAIRISQPAGAGTDFTDPIRLDDEEFLRRFAEHELLYFHREELREPLTEELVILLDQGVRTWGDVRLMLLERGGGAVRQAQRRGIAREAGGDQQRRPTA